MDRRNTQDTASASSSSGKQPTKATKEDVHTAMMVIIANEDYRNKLIRTANLIALLKYEWRKSGRELSIDKRSLGLFVGSMPSYTGHFEQQRNHPTGVYRNRHSKDLIYYFTDKGQDIPIPQNDPGWVERIAFVNPVGDDKNKVTPPTAPPMSPPRINRDPKSSSTPTKRSQQAEPLDPQPKKSKTTTSLDGELKEMTVERLLELQTVALKLQIERINERNLKSSEDLDEGVPLQHLSLNGLLRLLSQIEEALRNQGWKPSIEHTNVVSPVTGALMAMGPKLSHNVIEDRSKGSKKLQWEEGGQTDKEYLAKRKGKMLGAVLNGYSGRSLNIAVDSLIEMLNHKSNVQLKTEFLEKLETEQVNSVEVAIVSNVRRFINHNKAERGGTSKRDVHLAIEAVKQAVMFVDKDEQEKDPPLTSHIATKIGYEPTGPKMKELNEYRNAGKELQNKSKKFEFKQRRTRSDAYNEVAVRIVLEYCHSTDEGQRVDSNSFYVYKNLLYEDSKCPQRVWEDVYWKDRYKTFLKSPTYQKHLEANPKQTISHTVFRASVCKIIRPPRRNRV